MKINCPKCKKPFQLSSQRLSGDVVKIRCSSCGAVFKVRGRPRDAEAAPPASAPAAVPSVAPPPAAAVAVAWFAAIGKQRIGPFGQVALERLVAGGKVLPATRLWRKGLETWTPAGEIDELERLFTAPAGPPPAPQLAAAAPAAPTPAHQRPAPAAPTVPVRRVGPPPVPPKLRPRKVPDLRMVVPPAAEPASRPEPPEAPLPALVPEAAPPPPPVVAPPPGETAGVEPGSDALHEMSWTGEDVRHDHDEVAAEGFFEAGAQAARDHRHAEVIEFGVAEIAPVSLEEAGVAKGARETLRDFSVMARLSSRSRRRNIAILLAAGVVFSCALATLLVLGKDLLVGPQPLLPPDDEETLTVFAGHSSRSRTFGVPSSLAGIRPTSGDLLDLEEEWGTLDDQDLAALEQQLLKAGDSGAASIDRDSLRESFEKSDGKDGKDGKGGARAERGLTGAGMDDWGDEGARVPDRDGADTDFTSMIPGHGARPTVAPGGTAAVAVASRVVDRVETAGGGFLGDGGVTEDRVSADVKERKSSGKLWKLRAQANVMRKVKAQTKKIQSCADLGGVHSGTKIVLHVDLDGRVDNISSPEGGGAFTGCLMEIFGSFRVVERQLDKRINMPIILRFE